MLSLTPPPAWQRYGLPLVLCGLATALTLGMGPYLEHTPSVLFFVVVLLSAWYGGLGPGIWASLLSLLALHYFILSPAIAQPVLFAHEVVGLAMFLLVALLMATLTVARHRLAVTAHLEREWLRVTLSSLDEAVIATDTQGRVMLMNRVAEDLTGWTLTEAVDQPAESIFHLVDEFTRASVESPVTRVLRQGTRTGPASYARLLTHNRQEVPIEGSASPIRDNQGELQGVVWVFRDITERQRAEDTLRASEERFRNLMMALPTAVYTTNREGLVTHFNESAAALWGRRPELGQDRWCGSWRMFKPNGDPLPLEAGPLARALRDGQNVQGEEILIERPDGSQMSVLAYPQALRNADGDVVGAVNVLVDISERQRMQAALRESEDRFRSVFNTAPLIVWMAAPDGTITFANDQWFQYCGLTPQQNAREWPRLVLHPEDEARCLAAWTEALQTGADYEIEVRNRRHDGEYRWFITRATPRRDAAGQITQWFGTTVDIHERKQVESALQASEARYRSIFDTALDAVITMDAAGRITHWNPQAEVIFGWSRAEAVGRLLHETIIPAEQRQPYLRGLEQFLATQPHPVLNRQVEMMALRRSGEIFPVELAVTAIQTEGPPLFNGFVRDITRRRQTEMGQRLLATAGQVLTSSFNYEERLASVTRLVVPALADWSAVDILNEGEDIVRVSVFHNDPAKVELAHELRRRFPPDPNAPRGVPQVLRTGRAEYYPNITDDQLRATIQDPDQLQIVRDLGFRSALVVPLSARGRTLGALVLVMAESGRHYSPADLELAKELGLRVGLALDNARLYAETQRLNAQLENRILERTQQLRVTINELRREVAERQLAERKIRQNERRLKEAQQIAQLGSWYWDVAANSLTWSDELYRIYGLDPAQFAATYEGFLEVVHPDDRERVKDIIAQAYRDQQPFAFEHRIVRPDGSVRTLLAQGTVHPEVDSGGMAMEGTGQDITERKQAEAALHHSREQLRRLAARLQAVREEEQTRIAREIHDQLGGALTGLKMDVAALSKGLSVEHHAPLVGRANAMSKLIDSTIQDVRRIATELRPALLDDFGLLAAIEWQLQDFEARAGIPYRLDTTLDPLRLDLERSTIVFRVFQETLTNVARHANATQVDVRLEQQANALILQVSDNGRGISDTELSGAKSLGLVGMQERILMLAGELDISGRPGQGTTISIRIPLERVDPVRPTTTH